MIPTKIIHVGFGKTATTTLQLSILPKIADRFGLEYIEVSDSRIRLHASRLNLCKEVTHPLNAAASFIMSAEDLHSWDPFFWEEWADKNQQFFGRECHVLITIREPRSYLTSCYVQMCLHEGNVQSANDLFLNKELYSPYIASAKFAIDDFSYERIIDIYRSRFDKLTVVKFESMGDMSFWNEFFTLSETELSECQNLFAAEKINRSYSQRAIKLTFAMQKKLNYLGLSLDASSVRSSLVCLKAFRESLQGRIPDMDQNAPSSRNITEKLVAKIAGFFRWSNLMRRLDLYFPYHKFSLDFEDLPQIDIKKLMDEYERLPKLKTFQNKVESYKTVT